ncbi:MAG: phosphoadenylyl-sulfate reductase [Planctomycetota bacterium]
MTSTPPSPSQPLNLDSANAQLADASPEQVIQWAGDTFGQGLVMSTSFGVQSAVMLSLVTKVLPDVPVIFIDTGFHFQETYQFADELTDRLKLNLKVYAADESPSWFVARHGQLWDSDNPDDLNRYDLLRKVQPMNRALEELGATATLAGLRRQQTNHRANLRKVEGQDGRFKVAPILEWSTKDVHEYLKAHDLPYHPLHEQGYASIGDWHSTRPITAGQDERAGRFGGLKQECGLHLPMSKEEDDSRFSSGL